MPRCPKDIETARLTATCTEGLSFVPLLLPTATGKARDGSQQVMAAADWKKASFSQYERLGETVMGYTARTRGFRCEFFLPHRLVGHYHSGCCSWRRSPLLIIVPLWLLQTLSGCISMLLPMSARLKRAPTGMPYRLGLSSTRTTTQSTVRLVASLAVATGQ